MSFATRYNRGAKFNVNTEGYKYISLKDLQDPGDLEKVFKLLGLYINTKSKYGEVPVAIIEGTFVNLPKHLTEDVREMLGDPETVQEIRGGKCGFRIREYDDARFNRHCYSVDWADIK